MKIKINNILISIAIFVSYTMIDIHAFTTHPIELKSSTRVYNTAGNYFLDPNTVYNYDPVDLNAGLSMIKIVGSDFTLDGKGAGLYNLNNSSSALTGIEIGWSPAELAADPTRIQPKNIVIKNLSLNNFNAGIIIHDGVKRVYIDNLNINDFAVGVVLLGLSNDKVEEIKLSNIYIFNSKQDSHGALIALKTLIETTYGYGADYFIKLIADPNNSNTVDVYSYYGIWCNNVFTLDLNNVLIKNIGYDYKKHGSAGNGSRTQSFGCILKNSKHIAINKMVTHDIPGEINSVGLLIDNLSSISVTNSKFSYGVGGQFAAGIQVTNESSLDDSVVGLSLENVNTQNNYSDNTVKGMELSAVRGLILDNVSSKFNKGQYLAYGLYIDKATTVDMKNSTFSENEALRTTNDVATTAGIAAYGFYGNNINGSQVNGVQFNNMKALNSAYGIYINNSSSIRMDYCQFVANKATQMRSGEATDLRSQQDSQEISKHAPTVTASNTGAYGVFMANTNYVKFENCLANSNTAHRAIGMNFKSCRAVVIYNCYAATQFATGYMLDSSFMTDNIANPYAIEIKPAHIPLLFGGLSKTSVDAVTTTDLFLEKMSTVRTAQLTGNPPDYNDGLTVTAAISLLEATIARYRLWGTAIGIHANNVSGFLLKNCTCSGNVSMFDSGIGVCFTGRNVDHSIADCNLLFNTANIASVITASTNPSSEYLYSYNLMSTKNFWSTLLQTDVWTNITDNSIGIAVNSVDLSPDGNYLAAGLSNNNVIILNPKTGATVTTLTGHTAAITSVVFSPDGTTLATSSYSSTDNIKIWQISDWTNTNTLTHTSTGVNVLKFNHAGTRLASGATVSDAATIDNIKTWNSSTWANVASLKQGSGVTAITALAYNNDDTILATGSDEVSANIKIWDIGSLLNLQTLSGHTDSITSLDFNTDGTILASASKDDLIKIWQTSSWTNTQTITASAGDVNSLMFKNDGKLLASAHADNSIRIWSSTDWSSVQTFTDHTNSATSVAWSPDGRRIVSGSLDGYAKFYSTNIFSKATSTTQAGIYNPSVYFTIQGQKEYGNESVGEDVFIRLKSQDRALISPIGPIGGGIIMGDLLLEGVVKNSNLYANLGNAGKSAGAILDNAYSVTLDSNLISGNIANVYGMAVGVHDRTAHSANLFMKNFLEGNKCSTFNNSNYFVPFNPADANNLAFPVTRMYNGKFSNISTIFDNIEVLYSQNSQFYNIEYLASVPQHPDLVSYWTNNNCWL